MAFSDKVKKEALGKAAFRCIMCGQYEVFLEVHHIVPEGKGGSDDIDNALALCPNCHTKYGNNTDFRKFLKTKRDYWYQECERERANHNPLFNPEILNILAEKISKVLLQSREAELSELKSFLKKMTQDSIENKFPDQKYDGIKKANESFIDVMGFSNMTYVTSAVMSASTSLTAVGSKDSENPDLLIEGPIIKLD
jgi:hypothetical protein